MPKFRECRDYLDGIIDGEKLYNSRIGGGIRSYASLISPLIEIGVSGNTIANFGCASGYETFALMWFFEAGKVVGIDQNISGPDDLLAGVIEAIDAINRELGVIKRFSKTDMLEKVPEDYLIEYGIGKKDIEWWQSLVPSFLKEGHYPEFEKFFLGQKNTETSMEDSSYDISYCSSVLNHVSIQNGAEGVLYAINEMKRVLKPEGYLVTYDREDFSTLFKKVELEEFYINKDDSYYIYKKPAR